MSTLWSQSVAVEMIVRTPDGWTVASFRNPHSGAIYDAAQTRDGQSISYELLMRANRFVNDVWEPAAAAIEADPTNPAVRSAYEQAELKLAQFTDLISELRWITSVVDLGAD